jgi:class 3 adenylate cyclase/pimeloyl-ACP methyl ester carboxylesterase
MFDCQWVEPKERCSIVEKVQTPKTQYADSHGVSIAYQVIGEGPVDLVVVPGWVSNVETIWSEPIFLRLIRNLTRFARVILFDKRGTGCSDPVAGAPGIDERIDDIRAVMDAAGVQRAVLDGVSEGGPMAILFAATYPERVQALVLYGTYPKVDAPGEPVMPLEKVDRIGTDALDHWGEGRSLEVFAPDLAHDALQRRMWGVWERTGASPGMARALYNALRQWDVRPFLSTISAPTLVIHRTGDAIPIEGGRYLAQHIANAKLLELPGNNHVPFEPEIVDQICGAIEELVLGTRHSAAPERILSTVLFTDIVGSTERAATVGDRQWRAVLEDHDDIVRRQLERHRGREVKTLGDGFLATFDGPARAVQCARDLAEEIASGGLAVRAGIHTGECEVMGDDIGGMAVNLAARVAALAAPGEVLVTGTVHDLVIGSALRFEERGRHVLKGVPGEWPLFAAVGEADRSELSPLPTTTPATSVTDRAMDRVALHNPRLARMGARLSRRRAIAGKRPA